MAVQLTNSLTRKKETLSPLKAGHIGLYVCGPTVYNFIHIGNARPLVFFDVVKRYLEKSGFIVNQVMNYTDIDDKIIQRAKEEKKSFQEIVDKYIREYETDMRLLDVKPPTLMPRVSQHLPQIIRLIEGLIANGSAYVENGEVFFAVRKFADYGKLSGKNVDDLLVGARVEVGASKRDPLDFSLWKPRKEASEPAWESPWGLGRPGWHIECSAMAMEYLGESFDIHGGGMDLMHPHHENEIAQSEAFTKKPFVKYWMHNNMLNMNSEKMSKSLGNILLTREFIEKYTAETLKFMLLSGHYRSVIDFSPGHIRESQVALHRFYSTLKRCETLSASPIHSTHPVGAEGQKMAEAAKEFPARWREAMDDDFNTAKVVGQVFEYVRITNAYVDRKGFKPDSETERLVKTFVAQFSELSSVLNIFGENSGEYLAKLRELITSERGIDPKVVDALVAQRIEARKNKDFKTADEIRKRCTEMGIELRDSPSGTEWEVIIN